MNTYLPSLYTCLFIPQAVNSMLAYRWSAAHGIDVGDYTPRGNILEYVIVV